MKIRKKISDLIFDTSRDLKERVFVVLTMVAVLVVIIALVGDIIYGENIIETIVLAVTIVFTPAITIIGIRINKVELATRIVSTAVILVIMPIVFFFGGGARGAAVPWLVFSYLYIGLVLSGWWRVLSLMTLTGVVVTLFTLGYRHPEWIFQHSEELFYIDVATAVIEVGFVCFTMTWFQSRLFLQENARAKEETGKVEELNRSQNKFFSSMSHEIRTPINSILGLNEIILRQEDASEEIIRDANNIQGAGRMLLALINDILDFSKIEAGKMDIIPVNYSISEMISEIVNMLWLRAEQKGLELKIEVDPSIPSELFGDEVRIKQILVNLLNNAVKYTKEGSVTLHIEKEISKDDQVLLAFSVIDTGMGIKQDVIPFLFDAFKRVDEEKNTKIEGTGLGLSIVKQLVDLMDGKITVNSVYTQGSTFMVTLWQKVTRFDAVGELNVNSYVSSREGKYKAGFTAPEARILIVDDNEMNLEVEKKLLDGTEITIDTAYSGEEALSMTSGNRYDLILMDHLMPEMDGIECLQHIRKQTDGLNNYAPVIVLTANAGSENIELYNASGFDGYLVKPVSGHLLEETIIAHLPESKVSLAEGSEMFKLNMATSGNYSRKIPVLITTSSTCDLPNDIVREQQIDTIPYVIRTGGKVFYDGVEAGTDELLRYKDEGLRFETDPPEIEEFEKFFGKALKKAHNIIYIAVSSGLNSEYDRARAAAKAYGNVHVFDSGVNSAGVGLLVLLAHKMSIQGKTPERIIDELKILRDKIRCSFITDGSYFSQKSDFLDLSIYNYMQILNIRPIIDLKNGRYKMGRVAIGEQKECIDRYIDYALPRLSKPDTDVLIVIYVDSTEEELNRIETRIRKRINFKKIIFQKSSGVMAMNCGSGSIGLICLSKGDVDYNLSSMLMTKEDYVEASENIEPVEDEGPAVVPLVPPAKELKWYEGIEGIDPEVAMKNSGSEDAFKTVLKIFYSSIDVKSDEIDSYYNNSDWNNYTIKVHAMKSSSRLVGATDLGNDAEALEMAGKGNDIDYIKANNERVMKAFRAYKERLEPIFEERKEPEPEIDEATQADLNGQFDRYLIESVYEAVHDGARDKDDSVISETLAEISEYPMPPEDAEKIDKLRELFSTKDYEGMIKLIEG
ncbi:MAG: DegV family EDD domain-containing protein [Lachnospiraceae bacterium]|nr:DegV family EDD domain-containing protein [Lachnospiraceae bacterium]